MGKWLSFFLLIGFLSLFIPSVLSISSLPILPPLHKNTSINPAQKSPKVFLDDDKGILGVYIGQDEKGVTESLGEPPRRDVSAFGYEWWIYYNKQPERYLQVGIKDGIVVDLYSPATTWQYRGIRVGSKAEELFRSLHLEKELKFSYDGASFTLTNDELQRPLFLADEGPVLFYMDVHEQGRITGIRFMSMDILLESHLFPIKWAYTGKPPNIEPPALSETIRKKVERGNEQQIFDLTNIFRQRNGLPALEWNEQAAAVARGHSRDMLQNHFFGHISVSTGWDPFERMSHAGIRYRAAGENIASGQSDAIEAIAGWMNSEGHRRNILNRELTALGVGAAESYYTQNFVTPW